jgi:glutamyl-tRNA reductase
MTRRLSCVGFNHKTAPVELREQVAFGAEMLQRALSELRAKDGVDEVVILSTCNRVEVYLAGDVDRAPAAVRTFLRSFFALKDGVVDDHLVHRAEEDALHHLFRVASALDAVVVGEPQILGQVKDAFFAGVTAGTVGPVMTRAFHRAFTTAKRVRTETKIAAAAANVASAGVDLAASIFGDLSGLACVLVGAGDMGELGARHFARAGARLTIANRSLDRATRLADEVAGSATSIDALPRLLVEADVVLVSTGAPTFVVTFEMVKAALKARRYRPLLVVDISVPRNACPRIAELENCYVYDVDDLSSVVDGNLSRRADEAKKAEVIVEQELDKARKTRATERAVPVIKALREKAQTIAHLEAEKTLGVLGDVVSDRQRRSVEAMANAIVNKLLHEPMARLRAAAAADASDASGELLQAAVALFGLEATEEAGATSTEQALREASLAQQAGDDDEESAA